MILEPRHDDEWSLELTMVNDVAAAYLGRVGHAADRLVDTEGGLRACGLFELAQLVSLTSQEHLQEDLCAPGAAAAGSRIDLAITPLGDGAVSITFEDVSHRDSARSQ